MHRCFSDPENWKGELVELSAGESDHLLRVLRARPGETVEIFDGRGRVAAAKLVSGREGCARLATDTESLRLIAPEAVSLVLIQAVPKQAAMEEIIQKAVALGASKIVPVTTERTVVKFRGPARPGAKTEPDRCCLPADNHMERWRKIALAAAKQCQAAWLTEISPVASLQEAARCAREDLKIFGSLDPGARSLKNILTPLPAAKSIALAVGPEGDFTESERQLLAAEGFIPAGFGARVLRVATAAVFGLSVLKYEFQ